MGKSDTNAKRSEKKGVIQWLQKVSDKNGNFISGPGERNGTHSSILPDKTHEQRSLAGYSP